MSGVSHYLAPLARTTRKESPVSRYQFITQSTVEEFTEQWNRYGQAWTDNHLRMMLGGMMNPDLVNRVYETAIDKIKRGKASHTPLSTAAHLVITRVKAGKYTHCPTQADIDALIVPLWTEKYTKLVSFIASRIDTSADAEDLAVDTFLELHASLMRGEYRDVVSLSALLYGFARNRLHTYYQRNASMPVRSLQPDNWTEYDNVSDSIADPDATDALDAMINHEIALDVRKQLAPMSELGITVALLYWAEGWSMRRITETLKLDWVQCSNWRYQARNLIEFGTSGRYA